MDDAEIWYDAQLAEQMYSRSSFSDGKPTLTPASNFNPSDDADVLRKAMKGLGTNEDAIIRILTQRTLNQRIEIQSKYQQIHKRDLMKDLKSELNGIFEKVIMSLLKPLPLFFAEQIKLATKGAGTDEGALIEILCTRDDESLKTIQAAFEKEYGKSIETIVCKDTSGSFEKTLTSVLALNRNDSTSTPSVVADDLCHTEIDEATIRGVLTSFSHEFLNRVFDEYLLKTGEDLLQLIEKKASGDSEKAYKAIYLSSKSRIEYFAQALHEAMKGAGTDDWALIRIIVSRCEIDMKTIMKKYKELYGKDLKDQIKSEISGDYEKALLSLLGATPE